MKNYSTALGIFLATTIILNAQNKKDNGIFFGAMIGTKANNFNKHFIADVDRQLYSFSIGAGSDWTKNNYVIGVEFLYSNANKDNSISEIQYIGFSNTLSVGYTVYNSKIWKIVPNIGVVVNNNQVIIQDKTTNAFQNLTNNQICGNIGINIKALGKNGLFTGVKLGYITPFSGDTAWKNKSTGATTTLKDNVGSIYLQLNLGGFLDLTKPD